ncbi:MAG: tRNA threonylcarbamoyladenosine dehydratase, partial [Treponema sp.]|nr:tRNA threonylcarbamoyladenosine dehydratase [Treponema sp.]
MRNTDNPALLRLGILVGSEALEKFAAASVIVFGVGGVGSWCVEALARSGIGKITIVDFDTVCESNLNRQLQATQATLERPKVEALKERMLEINPYCEIHAWEKMFTREDAGEFEIEKADYIIDAIDIMNHKLDLIELASASGAKFFSSMGMARKMNPAAVKVASIWKTSGCPLARAVREGLRKRKFGGDFTVVYGEECLDNIHERIYDDGTPQGRILGPKMPP